jgi:hypothetical protein
MTPALDDNGTMQLFSPRCFVSWWCRRSHTPVFNKEKNYLDAVIGACQYFLRNEYPDLYFGLEETEKDAKSICL